MIDCKKCFHYFSRPGLKDHYEPRPTAHEGREDPIKQLDMF
jgi:hypothetical protein